MPEIASPARFALVTFDVYTALLDVESGLGPSVRQVWKGDTDPMPLVRTWRTKQLEYAQLSNSLQRGRISFRLLTRRALEYTFNRAGQPLSERQTDELVSAWDRLPAWPEANRTLAELQSKGYALGLLSNGDEDMLRAVAAASIGVTFDHVFASDHAGWYKPHPAMYALPAERLTLPRERLLHVAGSSTDVLGAKYAGLPCAWSNRHGDALLDPTVRPDYEVTGLAGLLDIL